MKQNIKIIFVSIALFSLCLSCTDKTSADQNTSSDLSALSQQDIKLELADKVFLIGPYLDSNTVDIEAACDCCGSDLATFKDSSFLFIAYCIDGNSYNKGKYTYSNNTLLLHYDSLDVKEINNYEEDSAASVNSNRYIIQKIVPITQIVQVSLLKSKPVLTFKYKAGTDYGMLSKRSSFKEFMKEIKRDSAWKRLDL